MIYLRTKFTYRVLMLPTLGLFSLSPNPSAQSCGLFSTDIPAHCPYVWAQPLRSPTWSEMGRTVTASPWPRLGCLTLTCPHPQSLCQCLPLFGPSLATCSLSLQVRGHRYPSILNPRGALSPGSVPFSPADPEEGKSVMKEEAWLSP